MYRYDEELEEWVVCYVVLGNTELRVFASHKASSGSY